MNKTRKKGQVESNIRGHHLKGFKATSDSTGIIVETKAVQNIFWLEIADLAGLYQAMGALEETSM